MSHFLNNPAIYNQRIRLTVEQRKAPYLVFVALFQDYRLNEIRHYLWQIVECCLTADDSAFQDASERNNLISFYEGIETAFEAAMIISQPTKSKK
jgi:hypothetical protein